MPVTAAVIGLPASRGGSRVPHRLLPPHLGTCHGSRSFVRGSVPLVSCCLLQPASCAACAQYAPLARAATERSRTPPSSLTAPQRVGCVPARVPGPSADR